MLVVGTVIRPFIFTHVNQSMYPCNKAATFSLQFLFLFSRIFRIFHVMLSLMEVQSEKNWQHLKGPESSRHRKMISAMEAFSFASAESVSFPYN